MEFIIIIIIIIEILSPISSLILGDLANWVIPGKMVKGPGNQNQKSNNKQN